MKLYREFKNFAVKGNMLDMGVGIILCASFNKVINVLVKEVMMPPLSLLSGNINLDDRRLVLKDAVLDAQGAVVKEEIAIGYGALIEAFIDFFVMFPMQWRYCPSMYQYDAFLYEKDRC